jgi:hypothetical protein
MVIESELVKLDEHDTLSQLSYHEGASTVQASAGKVTKF